MVEKIANLGVAIESATESDFKISKMLNHLHLPNLSKNKAFEAPIFPAKLK